MVPLSSFYCIIVQSVWRKLCRKLKPHSKAQPAVEEESECGYVNSMYFAFEAD